MSPSLKQIVMLMSIGFASSLLQPQVSNAAANLQTIKVAQKKSSKKKLAKKRAAKRNQKKGVRELFSEGQSLFSKKKYKEATAVFSKTLKQYPEHEPTILLYAKSAYLLEHYKDAYTLFSKTRIEEFDAETSYEYGYSFYANKNWQGALIGFKRIPQEHPLSDLSNYYGGISAIKLRRYNDAEAMLEKSVVLPTKLAKSRELYLKYLQEIRLMHQKRQLMQQKQKIKGKIQLAKKQRKQKKLEKASGKQKKLNKVIAEPAPKQTNNEFQGSMKASHKASLSTKQKQQLSDMSGLRSEFSTITISSFNFTSGAMGTFLMNQGAKGGYGIQFSFGMEDILSKGRESRILLYENLDSIQRIQSSNVESDHSKAGSFSAKPWIQIPVLGDKWLALVGHLSFSYPDFERYDRSGTRGVETNAEIPFQKSKIKLHLSYGEVLDKETLPTTTKIDTNASISLPLSELINLSGQAGYKVYHYLIPDLSGPDDVAYTSMTISHKFPLGVTLGGRASYEQIFNNISYETENFDFMSANGSILGGKIYASANVFSWLSLHISQIYLQTQWDEIIPENAADDWDNNVANYFQELEWSLKISRSF